MSAVRMLCISILLCMLSLHSFGQGCNSWMFPAYTTYYSSSNPNGNQITTSVTVDGTTNGTCPGGCNCSPTHTPKANNVIGSTGGWQSGAASPWNSYISKTNTQQIVASPGVLYPFSWGGEIICSIAGILYQVGNSAPPVAGFTPIQHNYPNRPLSAPCWISQFFDHVINGSTHHVEDVVQANSNNNGGITTPYGTPVYASEGGTVVSELSGEPAAPGGYPACVGTGALADYVKIKGSDGYYTAHVTPTVAINAQVTAGEQIGVTDKSGCQSAGHLHMARKDPNNNPVNFTIPCVNPKPTSNFADGLVNDDVPSTL